MIHGGSGPSRTSALPSPYLLLSFHGVPVASQPPSQHQPPPASPSASQPAAIQCARNPIQSSSKIPESPSSHPKPMKTKSVHRFLLCQSGRLQHPFWMPEASKVTPSGPQMESRSSQALPKWSLEAPKVTPAAPICSNGTQCAPIVDPGIPKIHPKPPKMLQKWSQKLRKLFFSRQSSATNVIL